MLRKSESSFQQKDNEGEHEAQRQAMGVHHLELGPGGDVVGLRELAGEHSAEQADD